MPPTPVVALRCTAVTRGIPSPLSNTHARRCTTTVNQYVQRRPRIVPLSFNPISSSFVFLFFFLWFFCRTRFRTTMNNTYVVRLNSFFGHRSSFPSCDLFLLRSNSFRYVHSNVRRTIFAIFRRFYEHTKQQSPTVIYKITVREVLDVRH